MTAPWGDEDPIKLSKTIKRAKRNTIIRNIVISFCVSLLLLFVAVIVNVQLINSSSRHAQLDEYALQSISGPNQYLSNYTDERGFLSGRLEFEMYKIIEGVPIPWLTKKTAYNVFPLFSFISLAGGDSSISLPDPDFRQQNFEYNRNYNGQNGQREMMFYIPEVDYNGKIVNDLPAVEQMDKDQLVEMAVSFDKPYSLAEVRSMLPAELTQMWYWVDTYDNRKYFEPYKDGNGKMSYAVPLGEDWLYGFGVNLDGPEVKEVDFIESLELGLDGRYHYEFNRIYNYLKGDKAKPEASDIRLLGVVVTGTAQEMLSLDGQPYVRAAALGAVVD
ncbi:anti-sigma factor [Paenibacillus sp. N4]|uniref:anti-sigma factor n=1 Tax=Paenibacillus vietnamensis TaxID=2590547 RepID=UPI001CD10593|nr:anti-sigma factor [Paenibacillus vietnamensis]MCA0757181.1 anti-sigma factor [Paenibacillus vietnamensis]